MSKQTAVEWLINELIRKSEYEHLPDHYFLMSDKDITKIIEQGKAMEAEQQNQLAIEFAEWVLTNEHIDTIWSTPKKELFQMFLKTKAQ